MQIDSGEINATISADDTVTFADLVPQFSKDELDRLVVQAQEHNRVLAKVERTINASKEYLTKVSCPRLSIFAAGTADQLTIYM